MEESESPKSISEELGSRITSTTVLAATLSAWTVPAAALAFVAGMELGRAGGPMVGAAPGLGPVRALMVVMVVFTPLFGAIWLLQAWDPSTGIGVGIGGMALGRSESERLERRMRRRALLTPHLVAGGAALGLAGIGAMSDRAWPWVGCAVVALVAAMIVPRSLALLFGSWSAVPVFAAFVVTEMTVGWLHLLGSSTIGSMLLLAEGLALAWWAVTAARSLVPAWARSAVSSEPARLRSPGAAAVR